LIKIFYILRVRQSNATDICSLWCEKVFEQLTLNELKWKNERVIDDDSDVNNYDEMTYAE